MRRTKTPTIVVDSQGRSLDPDDFDLDSRRVVAPQREVFAKLAEDGFTPERVSVDIQEKCGKHLGRKDSPMGADFTFTYHAAQRERFRGGRTT